MHKISSAVALSITAIFTVSVVSVVLQEHISSVRKQEKGQAYMQGSMNTIYYYRHRNHEPSYSWLVVSAEAGQIEDTEKAVSDLEIKARAWEVDHIKDTPR